MTSWLQVVHPIQHWLERSLHRNLFMARPYSERWCYWRLPASFDGDEGGKRLISPSIHAPQSNLAYECQAGRVIFVGVPSAEPTRAADRNALRCAGCGEAANYRAAVAGNKGLDGRAPPWSMQECMDRCIDHSSVVERVQVQSQVK
jgi:hypothetical protein